MKQKIFCKLSVSLFAVFAALKVFGAEGDESKPAPANTSTNAVTLEALVAEALEKNPEANFYKAEIAAAKGERRTAAAYPNPEVSGDVGRKRVSGGGLS